MKRSQAANVFPVPLFPHHFPVLHDHPAPEDAHRGRPLDRVAVVWGPAARAVGDHRYKDE
ncbi:MAG: hypothetical protein ABUK18_06165 [Candidatus Bathyarchaeia archaeon]